jgi:hypothetical protein
MQKRMSNFLYRGVNSELYEKLNGTLTPKETSAFVKPAEFARAEFGNAEFGVTELNAVIEHQQHQAGYPTSGISTTPHLERAEMYASGNGKYNSFYIYVIDMDLCRQHDVKIYKVNEVVPQPSIPEDDEVILVASDNRALPKGIIVDIKST